MVSALTRTWQEQGKCVKILGKLYISKIKKIRKCQLRIETINVTFSEICNIVSDVEKEKIEIGVVILFISESIVDSDRTEKRETSLLWPEDIGLVPGITRKPIMWSKPNILRLEI